MSAAPWVRVIGWAAEVTLPSGRYQGRTLGQLVSEDPSYIEWISRAWRDPGVRAAARVLLDRVDAAANGELTADLLASAIATARSVEAG